MTLAVPSAPNPPSIVAPLLGGGAQGAVAAPTLTAAVPIPAAMSIPTQTFQPAQQPQQPQQQQQQQAPGSPSPQVGSRLIAAAAAAAAAQAAPKPEGDWVPPSAPPVSLTQGMPD